MTSPTELQFRTCAADDVDGSDGGKKRPSCPINMKQLILTILIITSPIFAQAQSARKFLPSNVAAAIFNYVDAAGEATVNEQKELELTVAPSFERV